MSAWWIPPVEERLNHHIRLPVLLVCEVMFHNIVLSKGEKGEVRWPFHLEKRDEIREWSSKENKLISITMTKQTCVNILEQEICILTIIAFK